MFGTHLLKLFTPHQHNNHKPKLIHNSSLFVLVGLLIMAQSAITLIAGIKPGILGYASQISPQVVISLTNEQRKAVHLSELKLNPVLAQAAAEKAQDMFAKGYWAHNAPDGTEPWYFVLKSGYNYLHAGENLARDFSTPEAVVTAWMNSPTHKANILSSKYQDIGIAVVDGQLKGVETTLVVQMFGTPVAETPQVSANQTSRNNLVNSVIAMENTQVTAPFSSLKLSPFDVSRSASLAFIILVTITLAVDWLIIWRRNIVRISGRTWAHLTFFSTLIILIILLKRGLII
jgi:hypothetical protein